MLVQFSETGKRYIDGASGSSLVCNIGLGVKVVAAVLTPQAADLTYNPFHCSHSRAYEDMAERVMDACMERGLIMFPGHGTVDGTAGDHLLIGPPLVITANQVEDLLAILGEAICAVEKEIRP
jgi:adenosylmethionine-8-amino-7-oxononanoate aminotransferase